MTRLVGGPRDPPLVGEGPNHPAPVPRPLVLRRGRERPPDGVPVFDVDAGCARHQCAVLEEAPCPAVRPMQPIVGVDDGTDLVGHVECGSCQRAGGRQLVLLELAETRIVLVDAPVLAHEGHRPGAHPPGLLERLDGSEAGSRQHDHRRDLCRADLVQHLCRGLGRLVPVDERGCSRRGGYR